MPEPLLNYVWVGPPKLNAGGQDVCGPESVALNFKEFYPDESTRNPILFWCQDQYVSTYQDYFASKGLSIEVRSIDFYLQNSLLDCPNDCQEYASLVWECYQNSVLNNPSPITADYVGMKDLMFNFILATSGGYVLDTNIQAMGNISVNFPGHSYFKYPELRRPPQASNTLSTFFHTTPAPTFVPEVWMQYSPPNDTFGIAKEILKTYLNKLPRPPKIPSDDSIGTIAVLSLQNVSNKSRKMMKWSVSREGFSDVFIDNMGIFKEYCNTHRSDSKFIYSSTYSRIMMGDYARLSFDLDHGVSPNTVVTIQEKKHPYDPYYRYEKPYKVYTNLSLLNFALDYLKHKHANVFNVVNCMVMLLQNGADPNITTTFEDSGHTRVENALTIAIKLNQIALFHSSAVALLFDNAKVEIKVDQILENKSPLLLAVNESNIDAVKILLKQHADVNQKWTGQVTNPLTRALELLSSSKTSNTEKTKTITEIVSVLVEAGAKEFTDRSIIPDDPDIAPEGPSLK